MDYFYKVWVSYQGTHYHGMQRQKDTPNTIQESIHQALEKVCQSSHFKTRWASRTDTGVHALEQVGQLRLPRKIPHEVLLKGLNYHLPKDIRICRIGPIHENFNPRSSALWKEYWYLFSNTPYVTTSFASQLVANCPHPLNWSRIQEACQVFVGERDFRHFYDGGRDIKTTVRTIFECELILNPPHNPIGTLWYPYDVHLLRFRGQGFLKKMIRIMVGALWGVGRGIIERQDLIQALQSKGPSLRKKWGPAAPASGLYLKEIAYPPCPHESLADGPRLSLPQSLES